MNSYSAFTSSEDSGPLLPFIRNADPERAVKLGLSCSSITDLASGYE